MCPLREKLSGPQVIQLFGGGSCCPDIDSVRYYFAMDVPAQMLPCQVSSSVRTFVSVVLVRHDWKMCVSTGAFNGLVARAVAQEGFHAAYVSGQLEMGL